MSFASLGSTKYRCRRGVIGKYHTTFRGTFLFPTLYRPWPHTRHVVMSLWSPRYITQSLMQAWYLSCGRSRGHTTFLASSILHGNVFPFGRRSCQNCRFLLKLESVHLFLVFIYRQSSVTCKRVSCGRHPGKSGVIPSFSICASLALSLSAALSLLVSWRSRSWT